MDVGENSLTVGHTESKNIYCIMNMLWLISDTDRSIQALRVLKCLNCHCSCWRCFHPTQQYPLCSSDMNAWIKYVSTYVSVFELPRCKHSPPPPCRAGQRSEVAAQCSRGCLRFSTLLKDTSAACWALTLSSASLITTHHAASEKKNTNREGCQCSRWEHHLQYASVYT